MTTNNKPGHDNTALSRRSFVFGGALVAGSLALGLAGCGGGNDAAGESGSTGDGEATATKLRVATGQAGGYPWFDVDEQGNSTGYEADILREANTLLPQYEFELESITMTTQLTELANGTIDIGAHMYEDNQERRDNYLFTDVSIATMTQEFAKLKTNTEINSFDDIKGKRIITFPSSNSAYALEKYNEEHPDEPFEIIYVTSVDVLATDLITGNADATLVDPSWVSYYVDAGLDIEVFTNIRFVETGVYFLLPKDEQHEKIRDDLDGALRQLKDDGFIESLHEELFGYPAY